MDFDADDLKKRSGRYLPAGAGSGRLHRRLRERVARAQKWLGNFKFSFTHLIFAVGLLFMAGNIALSFHTHHKPVGTRSGLLGDPGRGARPASVVTAVIGRKAQPRALGGAESKKMASLGKLPLPGGFNDRVEDLVKK